MATVGTEGGNGPSEQRSGGSGKMIDYLEFLRSLGVGLSRILRYSYPGFLLILLGALVDSKNTSFVVDAIGPFVTVVSLIVVGAGLYAAHRSVVIPLHHLLGCLLFVLLEWPRGIRREEIEPRTSSPTRWLKSIGVKRCKLIFAYGVLRRGSLWDREEKDALNVAHAENGLVVITFVGFLLAWLYGQFFPSDLTTTASIILPSLSILFLVASYPMAFEQHTVECLYMRRNKQKVQDCKRR